MAFLVCQVIFGMNAVELGIYKGWKEQRRLTTMPNGEKSHSTILRLIFHAQSVSSKDTVNFFMWSTLPVNASYLIFIQVYCCSFLNPRTQFVSGFPTCPCLTPYQPVNHFLLPSLDILYMTLH